MVSKAIYSVDAKFLPADNIVICILNSRHRLWITEFNLRPETVAGKKKKNKPAF
jgi:hypothetical protein